MTLWSWMSVTTLSSGAARQLVWTSVTIRKGTNWPGRKPLPAGNAAHASTVPLFVSTAGLINDNVAVTAGWLSTCVSWPGFSSPGL